MKLHGQTVLLATHTRAQIASLVDNRLEVVKGLATHTRAQIASFSISTLEVSDNLATHTRAQIASSTARRNPASQRLATHTRAQIASLGINNAYREVATGNPHSRTDCIDYEVVMLRKACLATHTRAQIASRPLVGLRRAFYSGNPHSRTDCIGKNAQIYAIIYECEDSWYFDPSYPLAMQTHCGMIYWNHFPYHLLPAFANSCSGTDGSQVMP